MVSVERSGEVERLYSIVGWADDISSETGRRRFSEAYEVFSRVLSHEWFQDLLRAGGRVVVADICGGGGIGGLALSRALADRGVEPDLVVIDIRSSVAEKARQNSLAVLGREARVVIDDALSIYRHGLRADIALLYGLSTPHFDVFQMTGLVASIAWALGDRGVLIIEETDRVWQLYSHGARDFFYDLREDGRPVLSGHIDYDPVRGVFKRVFIDVSTGERAVAEFRLWDIAGTMMALHMFFRETLFIPIKSRYHGLLIARKPRGIDPLEYIVEKSRDTTPSRRQA